MLAFDFGVNTLTQTDTAGGTQSACFTDFDYHPGTQRLRFYVNGKLEDLRMPEISHETWTLLEKPRNWEALAKGLANSSNKTLDWLKRHGVDVSSARP